jgi:uncharacterized protein YneF (UPF0154 family)
LCVVLPIVCLIVGLLLGFYIAQKLFKKQMRENPPITEDQIRAMYSQMGRKPSEQQVRQIMNMFRKQTDKSASS